MASHPVVSRTVALVTTPPHGPRRRGLVGGAAGGQSLQDWFEWFQDRNLSGLTALRLFRDQAAITREDLPFDCYDAMPPVDIADSEFQWPI